jgi:HSP20 family molecular chaperone IbpA
MLYLWVFGDNIEDAFGHIKYLIFYLVGGLIASFTHIASLFLTLPSFGPVGFSIPSVGASGAISAVLGAYLFLYPRARIRTVVFYIFIQVISVRAYYYLGFWFLYQLIMGAFSLTGLSSGVAFWAHIGGFIGGLFSLNILGTRSRRKMQSKQRIYDPLIVNPTDRQAFVDLLMEENRIRVLAELPGMKEENIDLEVLDRELILSAQNRGFRFYRRVSLPVSVFPQVRELSYRNGILSFYLYIK